MGEVTMGRRKVNEEDKVETLMIHVKRYIRDNINNDPDAMSEIHAFIEQKWGEKDIEKYERQRRENRIVWLKRNIEINKSRLSELEINHGIKSDIYKMMSPAVIKKISEFENELVLIDKSI
ncbi:MAG: hypothetical protein ACQEXX_01375 [Bacillota bacterium]